MERLMTLREAAEVLSLEARRVRQLAQRGKLPGAIILPDGEVRFDRAAFRSWLETAAKDDQSIRTEP